MRSRLLPLSSDEVLVLMKKQVGSGGYQSLMRRLQKGYRKGSQELPITQEDIEQIQRYALDHGQGTWEEDLLKIFSRHLGPTLGREE